MNKFIYALGNAIWKIGSDAHYNLLKNHFTPLPLVEYDVTEIIGHRTLRRTVYHCPGCGAVPPLVLLYHKEANCCPYCGQAYIHPVKEELK